MPDDTSNERRLPEDVAHRLLARAVELDASRDTEVTLTQLREAAQDAGISAAAFDTALAELQREGAEQYRVHSIPPVRGHSTPLRRWLGIAEPATGVGSLREALFRNALALAAFWGILTFLVAMGRVADVEWLVRKATDPAALTLGAAAAARLRARPVGILLAGLAISTGAEFFMDAALGAPAVQGFGSHMALMIAGVAGVILGGRLLHRPPAEGRASERTTPSSMDAGADVEPPFQQRRALALRLRFV